MGTAARVGLVILMLIVVISHRLMEEVLFGQAAADRPLVAVAPPEEPPAPRVLLVEAGSGGADPARIDAPAPRPEAPEVATGEYVIQAGDSLSKISKKVYGTSHKWQAILDANRDRIPDEKRLKVGVALRIPKAGP